MRICVFGAGAVGGYLAGSISLAPTNQVSVIARGAHLDAIRTTGLTLELGEQTIVTHPTATADPADLGPQDAVIVTVKAPSLPSVAAAIGPLIGPDTAVAFVMNGIPWWYFHAHGGALDGRRLPSLDPGGALWNAVGPHRAIGGVFWPARSVPSPGVIRLVAGAGSGTLFGEPTGQTTPRLQALAAAFQAANLPVSLTEDIRTAIWRKLVVRVVDFAGIVARISLAVMVGVGPPSTASPLSTAENRGWRACARHDVERPAILSPHFERLGALAFNLSAGPLCVLTETPVLDTHTEPALIEASRLVLAEATALAGAMGITLTLDVPAIVATNTKLGHRPSILQDLTARRRMEVEALYGVPRQMARMVGVPTPTLDLLTALIKVKSEALGLYDRDLTGGAMA